MANRFPSIFGATIVLRSCTCADKALRNSDDFHSRPDSLLQDIFGLGRISVVAQLDSVSRWLAKWFG